MQYFCDAGISGFREVSLKTILLSTNQNCGPGFLYIWQRRDYAGFLICSSVSEQGHQQKNSLCYILVQMAGGLKSCLAQTDQLHSFLSR